MTIGDKIKKIRIEKGLSQSNLHNKQSAISQIESGKIKTPTESMLRNIAGNLGISFEELIDGTTWKPPHHTIGQSEYALSQTEVNIKIEDSGQVRANMKYYDAIDKNGNPNKYDPETGFELILECKTCKRAIQNPIQFNCFGCGGKLINHLLLNDVLSEKKYYMSVLLPSGGLDYFEMDPNSNEEWDFTQIEPMTGFTENLDDNAKLTRKVKNQISEHLKIESMISFINAPMNSENREFDGVVIEWELCIEKNNVHRWDVQRANESVVVRAFANVMPKFAFELSSGHKLGKKYSEDDSIAILKEAQVKNYEGIIKIDEVLKLQNNPNEITDINLKNWVIEHKLNLSFFNGLLAELMRHHQQLIELRKQKESDDKIKLTETETNEKEES